MAEASEVIVSPDKKKPRERGIEDYKRKIWKLKKELGDTRDEAKLTLENELINQRLALIAEKEQTVDTLKLEMRKDLIQMEARFEEKRAELETIAKRKDSDIHSLKQVISGHKQELRTARDAIESVHNETVSKLHRELKQLKHNNQELQQRYQNKQQDYRDKVAELKIVQEEAEQERQKLLNDALVVKLSRLKRDQDSNAQRSDRENERELRHKVTELTTTLKRLEKRANALKEENTNLRKTEASCRDVEEQGAKLKKRNAELLAALKIAEGKNKQLHNDSRKSIETAESGQGIDHVKKVFARQRAKDFAEHAKSVLSKDKEIESLQRKTLALTESLCNQARDTALQHLDMTTVLRQTTREKLVLEMRAKDMNTDDRDSRADLFNIQADLQDNYDNLLDEADLLRKDLEKLKKESAEKDKIIESFSQEKTTLHHQMTRSEKKCSELTQTNQALEKENLKLKAVEEDMQLEISQVKEEHQSALETVDTMKDETDAHMLKVIELQLDRDELKLKYDNSVRDVSIVKKQLEESLQNVEKLREENSDLLSQTTEFKLSNCNLLSELNEARDKTIPALIEASEARKVDITRLKLENEDLREEKEDLLNIYSENEDLTSKLEHAKLETLTLSEQLREQTEAAEKTLHKSLQNQSHEHNKTITNLQEELDSAQSSQIKLKRIRETQEKTIADLNSSLAQEKLNKDKELELIKRQFADEKANAEKEHDDSMNRLVDEHERYVASIREELNDSSLRIKELEDLHDSQLDQQCEATDKLAASLKNEVNAAKTKIREVESQLDEQEKRNEKLENSLQNLTSELKEQRLIAAQYEDEVNKLQQQYSRLQDTHDQLELQYTEKESANSVLMVQVSLLQQEVQELHTSMSDTSRLIDSKQEEYKNVHDELEILKPKINELEQEVQKHKTALTVAKKDRDSLENAAKRNLLKLKKSLTDSFETKMQGVNQDLNETKELNGSLQSQLVELQSELEDYQAKQISVFAGDNCYHLYVAKRAFDPSMIADSDSIPSPSKSGSGLDDGNDSILPAEKTKEELVLNAGDYVFVSGEILEEGYYEGNLLDGRSGLVPSNVLEPLYEFDIYGFVLAEEKEDVDTKQPADVSTFNSSMFTDSNSLLPSTPLAPAPYPKNLTLEMQFANSILVGWEAPDGEEKVFIYSVYVDNNLRASVKGANKCKALVEGVKALQPHRVSITATTSLGESNQRHCTFVIGEPAGSPTDLTVIGKDYDTAQIAFLPHKSNNHHLVVINGEEVRDLVPGVFSVDICGMIPETEYAITVAALHKPNYQLSRDSMDLKNLPFSVSTTFTMPVMANDSKQDNSSFLDGFGKFLGILNDESFVANDNHLPHELADADFLRDYDSSIPKVQHSQTSPSRLPHSTPNIAPRHKSLKSTWVEDISPIVLGSEHTPTLSDKGESTNTIGASDVTPTNHTQPHKLHELQPSAAVEQVVSPVGRSSSTEDQPSSRSDRSPEHRNSNHQNKNKSLHKMLKSLANSDKKSQRGSKSTIDSIGQYKSTNDGNEQSNVASDVIGQSDTPTSSLSPNRRRGQGKKSRNRSGTSSGRGSTDSAKANRLSADSSSYTSSMHTDSGDRLKPRPFIALYDYDPVAMSPNADAADVELKFKVDDVIYVFGDVDTDGFYLGELNGAKGYVPSNMVQEVTVTSPADMATLPVAASISPNLVSSQTRSKMVQKIALYDYDPYKLSPNHDVERELSFRKGDVITITGELDEDGFYLGSLNDNLGFVPSNYLGDISTID